MVTLVCWSRNEWTQRVYDAINEAGEIYLTSKVLGGETYAIRFCFGAPLVEEEHARKAFQILVDTVEAFKSSKL